MLLGVTATGSLITAASGSIWSHKRVETISGMSKDLFDQMDTDGNGAINQEEFLLVDRSVAVSIHLIEQVLRHTRDCLDPLMAPDRTARRRDEATSCCNAQKHPNAAEDPAKFGFRRVVPEANRCQ